MSEKTYFSGKSVGKNLKEVAVDLIKTQSEDLVSRWYHASPGTDLFTWADRRNNILKQQLNYNGQVVEWNCLEGIKTGVIIELEMEDTKESAARSETIKFDSKPQLDSIELALEILKHSPFEDQLRNQLIGNFRDPQNIETMQPDAFLSRFGLALKNYQKTDHGFWQNLRERFRGIFKPKIKD
jgi:hypothetical protein